MIACTSDVVTRLAIASEVDEAETCADDALDVHVPAVALVAPDAAGDAAADAPAEAAGELVDVPVLGAALVAELATALDVAAADGLETAAAEPEACADGDADVVFANADADGLTADDPNAAGEPLAPGVVPAGPHATERKRAAMAAVAMTLVLMKASRRKGRATQVLASR
jgi:hypothetical protein